MLIFHEIKFNYNIITDFDHIDFYTNKKHLNFNNLPFWLYATI